MIYVHCIFANDSNLLVSKDCVIQIAVPQVIS